MWDKIAVFHKYIVALFIVIIGCIQFPLSSRAASPNSPKEEVVYVNLDSGGAVKDIYVVNIFELLEEGQIIDYGWYKNIRNMTTTHEIHQSDHKITIDAGPGKFYYEGQSVSNIMPWNVEISYYLDGIKYSAGEIAGKSGCLQMLINITRNEACAGLFFEGYALQGNVILDTLKCSNIRANGATIANIGRNKQLTYTILPGKGAQIEITADVTDFEMEGISINGIKLELDLAVEDDPFLAQVRELMEAVEQLNAGAEGLYAGAKDLKNGSSSLKSGTVNMLEAINGLKEGTLELKEGIALIQTALHSLNAQSKPLTEGSSQFKEALAKLQGVLTQISSTSQDLSELTTASAKIRNGITALADAAAQMKEAASFEAYKKVMLENGLDIDTVSAGNATVINAVNDLSVWLANVEGKLLEMGIPQEDLEPIREEYSRIADLVLSLMMGNNGVIMGTESYLNGLKQGSESLYQGSAQLLEGYDAFDEGITELVKAVEHMPDQMSELALAVNMLVAEYEKLDTGIRSYTEAVAQIVAGYGQVSDGVNKIADGSCELHRGAQSMSDGTGDLDAGIKDLFAGTSVLQDAVSLLQQETAGMDEKISRQVNDLIINMTGQNVETGSFTAPENTSVHSVQFVMKTEAIEKIASEYSETNLGKPQSFWDKLLALFGF